jgi:hypothetical protein
MTTQRLYYTDCYLREFERAATTRFFVPWVSRWHGGCQDGGVSHVPRAFAGIVSRIV